jgi:hypothetical protein
MMRRLVLLLGSILGANAFTSPGPLAVRIKPECRDGVVVKLLSSNDNNDNEQISIVIDDLQKNVRIAVLGTFAAATIAIVPLISPIDDAFFVANAAVSPPATTIFSPGVLPSSKSTSSTIKTDTTTAVAAPKAFAGVKKTPVTTTKAKSTTIVDMSVPLASEKAALASAKETYNNLDKSLLEAKRIVKTETAKYDSAVSTTKSAQKKLAEVKKSLKSVNDKLAAATKKQKKNSAILNVYITESDKFKAALKADEILLTRAKDTESLAKKELSSNEKVVSSLSKSVDTARKNIKDAEKKLVNAQTKLKISQKKAIQDAKIAKEKAIEKAKRDKKIAAENAVKEKKREEKARTQAKKDAALAKVRAQKEKEALAKVAAKQKVIATEKAKHDAEVISTQKAVAQKKADQLREAESALKSLELKKRNAEQYGIAGRADMKSLDGDILVASKKVADLKK